ncbi:MAG: emp24/gp25L/p24 family protein [Gammaproteobacteria bacterium]|nr:emp24/gp25L/p24 family protein [Gammaproteobacteria bacterium]
MDGNGFDDIGRFHIPADASAEVQLSALILKVKELDRMMRSCIQFAEDVTDIQSEIKSILKSIKEIQENQLEVSKKQDAVLDEARKREDRRDKTSKRLNSVLIWIAITLSALAFETVWNSFVIKFFGQLPARRF